MKTTVTTNPESHTHPRVPKSEVGREGSPRDGIEWSVIFETEIGVVARVTYVDWPGDPHPWITKVRSVEVLTKDRRFGNPQHQHTPEGRELM